jgi:hypothetical protein
MLFVCMLWWARIRNQGFDKIDVTPVASKAAEKAAPVVLEPPVTPPPPVAVELPPVVDPVTPVVEQAQIPLTGLDVSPAINEYAEHATLGAGPMTQLAVALEAGGHFQRALLAWERVIDSIDADDSQRLSASQAIVRLRPTLPDWNADPKSTVPLILHVTSDGANKAALAPLLDELPKVIARASSAIVAVTVEVEYAKIKRPDPSVPASVAIWFSAAGKNAAVTEVSAFIPHPEAAETLRNELQRAVFNVVAVNLRKVASPFVAPRVATADAKPLEDLSTLITRAHWQHFANSLVKPAN